MIRYEPLITHLCDMDDISLSQIHHPVLIKSVVSVDLDKVEGLSIGQSLSPSPPLSDGGGGCGGGWTFTIFSGHDELLLKYVSE